MKKQHIQLNDEERKELEEFLAKDKLPVRLYKRGTAILALDRGETIEAVAKILDVTNDTVHAWSKRYKSEGIAGLIDKSRSGRPITIDGNQRAKITALACSKAPEGYSDWSLRLLADKVVELGFCESISHTQVGNILKKMN